MNQAIFLHFLLIQTFILSIYACIHFRNPSDGGCPVTSSVRNTTSLLRCTFHNPRAEINSSSCKVKVWALIINMSNLDEFHELIWNNNRTMMNLLHLLQKQSSEKRPQIAIVLRNLSSSTDRVQLTIDQAWVEKFFGHFQHLSVRWFLSFEAHDWNRINLTIHTKAIRAMRNRSIGLLITRTDSDVTCDVITTAEFDSSAEHTPADLPWCADSITLIYNSMYLSPDTRNDKEFFHA